MKRMLFGITMACLVLTAVMVCAAGVSGCASLPPYFQNPANTTVFSELGMNCVLAQPQEYGAGVMYTYLKTPTGYQMAQPHLIAVVVRCGNEMYSVLCDPSKPASAGPCANLETWIKQAPAAKVCK
jgi:hypothetical protein